MDLLKITKLISIKKASEEQLQKLFLHFYYFNYSINLAIAVFNNKINSSLFLLEDKSCF